MKKTAILSFAAALLMSVPAAAISGDKPKTGEYLPETLTDREKWCDALYTMAEPVLSLMSEGRLQEKMLVETSPTWDGRDVRVTYMECFGRLMAGLAPWISLPDDGTDECMMRKQLREWALSSYRNAVDPESPDCLLWESEDQTLVDAAYIAESFLRGYDALWIPLDSLTKQRYIRAFSQLRRVDPPYSNWLLFSATVECFLKKAASAQDNYRISSSLRKIKEWYVGDGWYSDGPHFAFDYYNSYVIHPMYVECMEVLTDGGKYGGAAYSAADFNEAVGRMQRFGMILERLISPEGTYPAVGRSITYRTGVLQPLASLKYPIITPTTAAFTWHHLHSFLWGCRQTTRSGLRPRKTGHRKRPGKARISRETIHTDRDIPAIQTGTSLSDNSEKTINFIRNFWLIGLIWIILQELS